MKKEIKEFLNELPKIDESRTISDEDQEMIGAAKCSTCTHSCSSTLKKGNATQPIS